MTGAGVDENVAARIGGNAADFARFKATCLSGAGPSGSEIQLVLINGLRADPAADFIFARDAQASGIFG